jgi:hypothetical protein
VNRIAIPALCALLAVVAFIVLSGYNRSGNPLSRISVTERELRFRGLASEDRDRGLELRFDYARRADPLEARNWLTEDKMRAVGFTLNVMPGAPEAADTYGRSLPRVAWVAFEYDGGGWREIERQRQLRSASERHPGMPLLEPSRLVPVDAGPDPETLAARYPQGHLILRASLKLGYLPPDNKGPLVHGWIRDLIPSTVHVPREFRDLLASLPPLHNEPRYDVDLEVGRLGVPYVTGVRRR